MPKLTTFFFFFTKFSCIKPNWQHGSALPRKKKAPQQKQSQNGAKVWSLSTDDIVEADLEDENKLLEPEDLIVSKKKPASDCETGPRKKACKNCSCGRAEQQQVAVSNKPQQPSATQPKSACGNVSFFLFFLRKD